MIWYVPCTFIPPQLGPPDLGPALPLPSTCKCMWRCGVRSCECIAAGVTQVTSVQVHRYMYCICSSSSPHIKPSKPLLHADSQAMHGACRLDESGFHNCSHFNTSEALCFRCYTVLGKQQSAKPLIHTIQSSPKLTSPHSGFCELLPTGTQKIQPSSKRPTN